MHTRTPVRSVVAMAVALLLFVPSMALADEGVEPEGGGESQASIWTAKDDYVPAELVDINGAGWQPNERVELFVDDHADQTWNHRATVTADAEGAFYHEFRLPSWFVAVYTVTATGESGTVVETTFDDSIAQGSFGTNHNSGNTELTISAPAAAVGDVLVAHLVATDSVSGLQFCPVQSGWNTTTSGTNNLLFRDSQNKVAQQVFWRVATAANASAVSYNFNFRTGAGCSGSNQGKGASGGIIAFSGVDTTNPIDAAGGTGGTNSSTSGNAPNVNTTTADTKVLRFFGLFKNASIGPSAEPPRIYSINSSSGKERAAAAFAASQSAAGATGTFTGTFGSSGEWVAQTVALRSAAVVKQNQTITFAQPTSPRSYGDIFNVNPVSDSGLAVALQATGSCSVSPAATGYDVQMTSGSGDCVLTASQAGNDQYNAATDVVRTVAAQKRAASVTPDNNSKVQGTADPDPLTTGMLNGFLPADNVTASYSRQPGEAPGDYTITATLSPASVLGNYDITYNTAVFTIEPAAKQDQTITFAQPTSPRSYGDTFNVNPTASSGMAVSLAATGPCSATAATTGYDVTMTSGSGTCTLTASQAGNDSYNAATDVVRTVVAQKRVASVTPTATGKTYGEGDPTLTGTLSGFLDGDNVTATYSRTAGETVAGSPYTIGATLSPSSVLDNYDITYNTTGFTISARPIIVTADAKSKVFGASDPTFTWELTSGTLVGSDEITGSLSRTGVGTSAGEAVGQHPILVGSLSAGSNYDLTYVGANLTISAWDAQGYGFYQPVGVANSVFVAAPGPVPSVTSSTVWNAAKGGSTIPLKFHVYAGGVEKTSTSDIKGFSATKLSACTSGSGEDDVEFVTSGNTSLRYDSTEKQFIQNWKTPTSNKEECYRATVTFQDGSSLSAFFRLRR